MHFIPLTARHTGERVYINLAYICRMHRNEKLGFTELIVAPAGATPFGMYNVLETPEEILTIPANTPPAAAHVFPPLGNNTP